jgi:patatin-like phospholipase/acyl hydrolase
MAFQILALSGGGYRGLFTVSVLRRLEEQAQRPIGECFDLIAGTSIGGLVAIGLALGKPAEMIEKVFLEKGETIFPKGEPKTGFIPKWRECAAMARGPKYDGSELRKAIESVVGVDALIGDARTRLLIPAINMTKGSVQMFKTAHCPQFVVDKKRKAADVAMATSAAPFYFPLAQVGDAFYADGGLAANAPDLCAIHEATKFLGRLQEDIHVLSIGTTTTKFSLPTSLGRNLGAAAWVKNMRLLSTFFAAQQQLVNFMVAHQLGDRYLRIDETPSLEQCVDLGLDLATPERRQTLLGMAEGAYQNVAANPHLREFLDHQPEKPIFY